MAPPETPHDHSQALIYHTACLQRDHPLFESTQHEAGCCPNEPAANPEIVRGVWGSVSAQISASLKPSESTVHLLISHCYSSNSAEG